MGVFQVLNLVSLESVFLPCPCFSTERFFPSPDIYKTRWEMYCQVKSTKTDLALCVFLTHLTKQFKKSHDVRKTKAPVS